MLCLATSICMLAGQICLKHACQPFDFGACLMASRSMMSCKPSCPMLSMSTHANLAAEAPPDLPPHLEHLYIDTTRRHRVDAVRRCIHALDLQRVLVFMNYQQRLKVGCASSTCLLEWTISNSLMSAAQAQLWCA